MTAAEGHMGKFLWLLLHETVSPLEKPSHAGKGQALDAWCEGSRIFHCNTALHATRSLKASGANLVSRTEAGVKVGSAVFSQPSKVDVSLPIKSFTTDDMYWRRKALPRLRVLSLPRQLLLLWGRQGLRGPVLSR